MVVIVIPDKKGQNTFAEKLFQEIKHSQSSI